MRASHVRAIWLPPVYRVLCILLFICCLTPLRLCDIFNDYDTVASNLGQNKDQSLLCMVWYGVVNASYVLRKPRDPKRKRTKIRLLEEPKRK